MNLPTQLQARIEKEAEAHVGQYDYDLADDNEQADYVCCKEDYKAGAEGLFEILSAQKPELSREEIEWFSAELRERYNLGFDEETNAVNLGLWVLRQCHQQSAAVIAALNAFHAQEVIQLESIVTKIGAERYEARKERDVAIATKTQLLADWEIHADRCHERDMEMDALRAECERLKKDYEELLAEWRKLP